MKPTYKVTNAVFRPKTGRPSQSGLSVKQLGRKEYDRRYEQMRRELAKHQAQIDKFRAEYLKLHPRGTVEPMRELKLWSNFLRRKGLKA